MDNPVNMPAAWDFQGSTATAKPGVAKDWWKGFDSPVLNGLIEQALKNNPSIIATEERLKQAERTLQQNRDSLLPDPRLSLSTSRAVSGSGDNADGNPALGGTTRPTQSTSLGLSSSYTVDLWGGTAASYRTQRSQLHRHPVRHRAGAHQAGRAGGARLLQPAAGALARRHRAPQPDDRRDSCWASRRCATTTMCCAALT